MNKFKRVLSDEYIDDIVLGSPITIGKSIKGSKDYILMIEQAILAKLAEQEPIAYEYDDEVYGNASGAINDYIKQHGQPLYAYPVVPKYTGE